MRKSAPCLLLGILFLFLAAPRAPAQATVPLYQFLIFYNTDLEVEPGANSTIIGQVQCNSNIWLFPDSGVTLTFSNDVTAAGSIYNTYMPDDPDNSGSPGTVIFDGKHISGTNQWILPIGTNYPSSNAFTILQIPPPGEDPASAVGTNRFYNLADTVLLISNSTVTAIQGSTNGVGTTIPTNIWQTFLNTNLYFVNGREKLYIQADLINVSNLVSWAQATSNTLPSGLAPNTIYIADERSPYYISNYTTGAGAHLTNHMVKVPTEPSILLYNGAELPKSGLTVALPNPVYIWGNYNTTTEPSHRNCA